MLDFADPGGEFYFSTGVNTPGIWLSANNATLVNNAPAGRSTTYGISLGGITAFLKWANGTNYTTFIASGALYISAGAFSVGASIISFLDGTNLQCDLRVNATGNLYFTRNGTTIGTVSSNALASGAGWTYFEVQVTINGSTGSAQVWVNGVSWLSLTGVNTQATVNSTLSVVEYGVTTNVTCYWKDMIGIDTAGGAITTRQGDVTVGVRYPNASGVNQAWTNNGGSSQTNSVQDGITHTGTWPDGDATYISSSTTNQISDFSGPALSLTGSIIAVHHMTYARKDDAGTRQIAQVGLSAAVVEVGATISLGNSYQYYRDILEVDPNTSAAWTLSGFNAATFGVKELT